MLFSPLVRRCLLSSQTKVSRVSIVLPVKTGGRFLHGNFPKTANLSKIIQTKGFFYLSENPYSKTEPTRS